MGGWVYRFGGGAAEGDAGMGALLGGKGANLAEMAGLGLPVPPGFTIATTLCNAYYAGERALPDGLAAEVDAGLRHIEGIARAGFGDPDNALLVSVRSGARASMPGMMDTVLNLGLNDETVRGLARRGGARFACDSYRRFIQMYGDVVLGIESRAFEELLERAKESRGHLLDTEMEAGDWRRLVEEYKALVRAEAGREFPQEPRAQLLRAIRAVLDSWMNARAVTYRKLHGIPADWGTAVTVQAMVFGNMGDDCASGVAFTRDPSTGEATVYGEYLANAQGEDVVAGIRTPRPVSEAARARDGGGGDGPSMERAMPRAFAALREIMARLEAHYRDMQDIEFTVQQGRLWILQTRAGKRTARAALKIAVDMVAQGLVGEEEALARVDPLALEQLLHPALDPDAPRRLLARGLPASPGAACGKAVFDSAAAEERAARGEAVILIRAETSPEDIHGMHAARGIVTSRGGMTSHAAVVARGMGRPCITGAGAIRVDREARSCRIGDHVVAEGDVITIDGAEGALFEGAVPTVEPALSGDFATLMAWADRARRLRVRANAETPADARTALRFGAEGIGLCRTEHMFFDEARLVAVREMILAADADGRRAALAKLLPMQRADFVALFRIMAGKPVTIRLLDPPLHEFLPGSEAEIARVAAAAGVAADAVRSRIAQLRETNPMLGHRGCRLGISYPEIYEMQARAIFEAAAHAGGAAALEIMIPLVATRRELDILKGAIEAVHRAVAAETGAALAFSIGTMIELPRAALRAGEIAESAAFFSFGTNDLTQTAFGLSRDDAAAFVGDYERAGILVRDPFVSLDREGVGELVALAVERGRAVRADLKLGVCGEHGGDPASIAFFEKVGLDYVSCSPYRVPIARLAAAQAAIAVREGPEA